MAVKTDAEIFAHGRSVASAARPPPPLPTRESDGRPARRNCRPRSATEPRGRTGGRRTGRVSAGRAVDRAGRRPGRPAKAAQAAPGGDLPRRGLECLGSCYPRASGGKNRRRQTGVSGSCPRIYARMPNVCPYSLACASRVYDVDNDGVGVCLCLSCVSVSLCLCVFVSLCLCACLLVRTCNDTMTIKHVDRGRRDMFANTRQTQYDTMYMHCIRVLRNTMQANTT